MLLGVSEPWYGARLKYLRLLDTHRNTFKPSIEFPAHWRCGSCALRFFVLKLSQIGVSLIAGEKDCEEQPQRGALTTLATGDKLPFSAEKLAMQSKVFHSVKVRKLDLNFVG